MISAALIWSLVGLCLGSLCGWCGIAVVRLLTRDRSEGWLIAGADVVVVSLLLLTALLAYLVGLVFATPGIGLNSAESTGFILGVCAFDAGALAGMFTSLLAELSRRREQQQRAPLALFSKAWLSSAWGSE